MNECGSGSELTKNPAPVPTPAPSFKKNPALAPSLKKDPAPAPSLEKIRLRLRAWKKILIRLWLRAWKKYGFGSETLEKLANIKLVFNILTFCNLLGAKSFCGGGGGVFQN